MAWHRITTGLGHRPKGKAATAGEESPRFYEEGEETINTTSRMSHKHVEAITWATWGLNVGPLKGKQAFTARGVYGFSSSTAYVDYWWGRYPDANIGAAVPPGHVVVDIDPRNGGDSTWDALTTGHELPPTLVTRTGSGGRHIWFRLPYARPVRGSAGPGIDLKARGGYLVMPGSIHPDTGRLYRVEQWSFPTAMLPTWLAPHVYRPAPKPRVIAPILTAGNGDGLVRLVAEAADGNRNRALYWAARRAAADGLDLEDQLHAAALTAGLEDLEARRTIASARRATESEAA